MVFSRLTSVSKSLNRYVVLTLRDTSAVVECGVEDLVGVATGSRHECHAVTTTLKDFLEVAGVGVGGIEGSDASSVAILCGSTTLVNVGYGHELLDAGAAISALNEVG